MYPNVFFLLRFAVALAAEHSAASHSKAHSKPLNRGQPADEFPDSDDSPTPNRQLPPRAAAWLRLYANVTIPYHALAEFAVEKLHGINGGVEYPSIQQPYGDIYHFDDLDDVKVIVIGAGTKFPNQIWPQKKLFMITVSHSTFEFLSL